MSASPIPPIKDSKTEIQGDKNVLVLDQIITLIKEFGNGINDLKISPSIFLRIIEILVKFDPESATAIVSKIKKEETGLRIASSLLMAQIIAETDHFKALQICDQLFEELISLEKIDPTIEKGLVFVIDIASNLNKRKSDEMRPKAAAIFDRADQKILSFLQKISHLSSENKIKVFLNFVEGEENLYFYKKLAAAGAIAQNEILPSTNYLIAQKVSMSWKTKQAYKDPQPFLQEAKQLSAQLEGLLDQNYLKAYMKIWLHLQKEKPDAANNVLKEAIELAGKDKDPSAYSFMAKFLNQFGFVSEGNTFAEKALELIKPRMISGVYNRTFAEKLQEITPEASAAMYLNDLAYLGPSDSQEIDTDDWIYCRIADKASSRFWKNETEALLELFNAARIDLKLLYLLKIFDASKKESLKKGFVTLLKQAEDQFSKPSRL